MVRKLLWEACSGLGLLGKSKRLLGVKLTELRPSLVLLMHVEAMLVLLNIGQNVILLHVCQLSSLNWRLLLLLK